MLATNGVNLYAKIKVYIRREWLLCGLLLLAFVLRVVGVGYGLPLTVVSDETPFTLAALQMIQLHTLVPAFHPDAFVNILPYPPYISYVLLLPFVAILGIKFLLWHGSVALFGAFLLTDLSAFFITARLIDVALGVLSVYFVYRISEAMFRSRIAAGAAGFLLATSILHEALSMVGRNWMPTSVVFLSILFVLTQSAWSLKYRYAIGFVIAGFGMGISAFSAAALPMMGTYYFCFDVRSAKEMFNDMVRLSPYGVLFCILAVIPSLLWHSGNAFVGAISLFQDKSLTGLLISPWSALSLMIFSEPVLIGLFFVGLAFLFTRHRKIFTFIGGWTLLYVAIFYVSFRFETRFLIPLIPLFALAGGYCVARLWDRRIGVTLCALFLIPLIVSLRLDYLVRQGDTREHVREWALEHLKPSDRVLIYSSAFHLTTGAEAVAELRAIDPRALRKVDVADEQLNRSDVPYALNDLLSVTDQNFIRDLPQYAASHGYEYLILEPGLAENSTTTAAAFASLTKKASVAARFDGLGSGMSISESAFTKPLMDLFAQKTMGPDMVIYQLHD